jgi:hypothetical protein
MYMVKVAVWHPPREKGLEGMKDGQSPIFVVSELPITILLDFQS